MGGSESRLCEGGDYKKQTKELKSVAAGLLSDCTDSYP